MAVGFRTLLSRTADLFIPSANRLPVEFHDDSIQDPGGNFYIIDGYSKDGGPDIPLTDEEDI